jgi:2-phospho-L-lactate guanylyltransferase
MSDWAIIPVKALGAGKTRLASVLTADERRDLNRSFLKHTLRAVLAVFPPQKIVVVSGCTEARAMARAAGMCALVEEASSLNAALEAGADQARAAGAKRVLSLSTDLPYLQPEDLRIMLGAPVQNVVVAPDQRGIGTNALLQPPGAIRYAYGDDSHVAHAGAAKAAHLTLTVVDRPGLRFDIDTPEDWRRWQTCREGNGAVSSSMTAIR